ncbi:NAD(P)/FAD-dependent oxidoreductase [Bacilliculturomica massiliensis]|uniref:NAD(P)/FAD-dependent oxidoreductase n=1 Tax=Bacilliculturomica massiliensis TaxID=1917867 RepID=UPI00103223A8|nr:NAD(P)/FAD-dependent oxidoreductase [Bacilliculturomica massiliensis]
MYNTDILVVGAGAVGIAIARELSKFNIDVMVVDKKDDVGGDASKSCSSCISTEFTLTPGTLESKICQCSRPLFDQLCRDLDVPLNYCGSITPAVNQEQFEKIPSILKKAFDNGVYDVEYRSKEELLEMEPNLNPEVLGGVYSPRDTQINQFLLVVAQAENAAENGVEFLLDCKVEGIELEQGRVSLVRTTKGDIRTKYIVNAAGLGNDEIAGMVGECDYTVHPRKGQFYVLEKDTPVKVSHIILSIPLPQTRGKLIIPTVDGNILVGPTAEDLYDKDDKKTTKEGLKEVEREARMLVPGLHMEDTITQFVGLRPAREPEGYNILVSEKARGYVGISGVRSSGLTGSLGIAKYTIQMMREAGLTLERKKGFKATRKGIVNFSKASDEERDRLIAEDPLYGHVICRCETVTESEIVQAIRRPVGARTVDAVKRRVRAGMGRCQGGFCGPQVLEILARELGVDAEEIRKRDGVSYMLRHEK